MALTHIQIGHLKPAERPYKVTDGGALYLIVQPNGSKLWRMNYRYLDKQRTLSIGIWPDVSIAKARERRDNARTQLADGIDPVEAGRAAQLQAQLESVSTFKAVAEEWIEKNEREGLAPITLSKIEWLLSFAYPTIGNRPIAQITPIETLAVLRKVEARGHFESARRMRSVLSRVFRYAIATGRADRDAAADLRGALTIPKVRHRAAITDPKEAGKLIRAIEDASGRGTTVIALRMLPHLFVRPGELRSAEWTEFDLDAAVWSIPAEKMKMRRPHRVPLSRQVMAMLEELKPLSGFRQHLFPAQGRPKKHMSEMTLNVVLQRIGFGPDQITPHGFRAMAATLLNEMGLWNPDAIERQLAHMDGNQVRQAYARGQYWEERVRMMQHWSDYLDELRRASR